jgi:hypothetical protein
MQIEEIEESGPQFFEMHSTRKKLGDEISSKANGEISSRPNVENSSKLNSSRPNVENSSKLNGEILGQANREAPVENSNNSSVVSNLNFTNPSGENLCFTNPSVENLGFTNPSVENPPSESVNPSVNKK